MVDENGTSNETERANKGSSSLKRETDSCLFWENAYNLCMYLPQERMRRRSSRRALRHVCESQRVYLCGLTESG
jgi:hypothetical protein